MTPEFNPDTFETNVPGVFLAGGAICGKDTSNIFIENGRFHGETIIKVIAERLGKRAAAARVDRAEMAEGRGQTVQIQPPSVRTETVNVMKAAAAIVVIVAAYIFRPSLACSRGSSAVAGLLPYQKLIRDARAGGAARVSRAAGRAARSRAAPCPDRPLAGRECPRAEGIPPSLAIPLGKSTTPGRPSGRIGRPITSACRRIVRSLRGCSSSWSPSRGAPRSRTQRRDASSAARWDDTARVHLECARRETAERFHRAQVAAERRLDELAGGGRWTIAIAVSNRGTETRSNAFLGGLR